LLYGCTGEFSIQGVNSILTVDVGKVLITISLLFKITAAPFHMWAPDVYQGAPTIITALLATVPKISIFSILLQISPVINIILLSSIISIIWGALGALNQANIKRLIAYSSINHMGFILLAIGINTFESIQASLIYIIIYLITTICNFTIILSLGLKKNIIVEISGLGRYSPIKGITLSLVFLSIAGIPPLAGFLGKLLILLPAIASGYFLMSIIVIICSVIAGVYYIRLVHLIYFPVDYSLLA
jgi:NADH-quinone oxidoreductase subunit N